MYISEIKLRTIIRQELLNENVDLADPNEIVSKKGGHKAGKPLEIGSRTEPENSAVIMVGVPKEQIYQSNNVVVLRSKNNVKYNFDPRDKVFEPVKVEDLSKYKFANKSASGNVTYTKEKITQFAKEGRLAIVPVSSIGMTAGAKELTFEKGPTTMEYADLIYDTAADTVGTAAGLFGPGFAALGASINASQAIKKFSQGKIRDGIMSAIGAMTIPAFQQTVIPGLKNLAIIESIAKGAAANLDKLPGILSLIDGIEKLLHLTKSHKKILLKFIRDKLLPSVIQSAIPAAPVGMTIITQVFEEILEDIQSIIDAFK